jgi:hypothetical protein
MVHFYNNVYIDIILFLNNRFPVRGRIWIPGRVLSLSFQELKGWALETLASSALGIQCPGHPVPWASSALGIQDLGSWDE